MVTFSSRVSEGSGYTVLAIIWLPACKFVNFILRKQKEEGWGGGGIKVVGASALDYQLYEYSILYLSG